MRGRVERQLVDGRLDAEARRDVVPARLVADADRVPVVDGGDLGERLVDEDDGDEHGEALLGEARDVAHHEAEVERDDQQQDHGQPEPDPEPQRHEVDLVRTASTQSLSRYQLHWLKLPQWIDYKLAFLVYKCLQLGCSAVVPRRRPLPHGRSGGSASSTFGLVTISGCAPSYAAVDVRRPSFSGRRLSSLEHFATPRHV